jgi:hypothetical protein
MPPSIISSAHLASAYLMVDDLWVHGLLQGLQDWGESGVVPDLLVDLNFYTAGSQPAPMWSK